MRSFHGFHKIVILGPLSSSVLYCHWYYDALQVMNIVTMTCLLLLVIRLFIELTTESCNRWNLEYLYSVICALHDYCNSVPILMNSFIFNHHSVHSRALTSSIFISVRSDIQPFLSSIQFRSIIAVTNQKLRLKVCICKSC